MPAPGPVVLFCPLFVCFVLFCCFFSFQISAVVPVSNWLVFLYIWALENLTAFATSVAHCITKTIFQVLRHASNFWEELSWWFFILGTGRKLFQSPLNMTSEGAVTALAQNWTGSFALSKALYQPGDSRSSAAITIATLLEKKTESVNFHWDLFFFFNLFLPSPAHSSLNCRCARQISMRTHTCKHLESA